MTPASGALCREPGSSAGSPEREHLKVSLALYGNKLQELNYDVKYVCTDGTSATTKFHGKFKGKHVTGSFTLTFDGNGNGTVKCTAGTVTFKATRGKFRPHW
jgi:hypothetical protein